MCYLMKGLFVSNESTEQLLNEAILTTYKNKSLLSHKAVYLLSSSNFSESVQKKIQSMFIRLLSMLTKKDKYCDYPLFSINLICVLRHKASPVLNKHEQSEIIDREIKNATLQNYASSKPQ